MERQTAHPLDCVPHEAILPTELVEQVLELALVNRIVHSMDILVLSRGLYNSLCREFYRAVVITIKSPWTLDPLMKFVDLTLSEDRPKGFWNCVHGLAIHGHAIVHVPSLMPLLKSLSGTLTGLKILEFIDTNGIRMALYPSSELALVLRNPVQDLTISEMTDLHPSAYGAQSIKTYKAFDTVTHLVVTEAFPVMFLSYFKLLSHFSTVWRVNAFDDYQAEFMTKTVAFSKTLLSPKVVVLLRTGDDELPDMCVGASDILKRAPRDVNVVVVPGLGNSLHEQFEDAIHFGESIWARAEKAMKDREFLRLTGGLQI
ncbi:hypothetical protein DL96DRAFT_1626140 [Flagelloscypha sp. PMI_526]|nr:hypothetical protein DL96DRAFT_1626140 [Flagelloscypha sp. PMI_526]